MKDNWDLLLRLRRERSRGTVFYLPSPCGEGVLLLGVLLALALFFFLAELRRMLLALVFEVVSLISLAQS